MKGSLVSSVVGEECSERHISEDNGGSKPQWECGVAPEAELLGEAFLGVESTIADNKM